MNKRELIDTFIKEHQYKLFGFIINRVNNLEDSEDLFQTVIEKVICKIESLREPNKINSWILKIASNEINSYYNSKKEYVEIDFDNIEVAQEYNDFDLLVNSAINSLSSNFRDVFYLRFYNELSYKKIAFICDIPEGLVKSRLFDAKRHIKTVIPNLYHYTDFTDSYFKYQKENIVMELESVELGSYVFSRLSLNKQVEFCISAVRNLEFSNSLLEEIGKVKKGKEFILIYHSKVVLRELVNFLNLCDRYTEKRVIQELEKIEPVVAETIKNSMFVFEDIIIADNNLIKEIFQRVENQLAAKAIAVTITQVKDHILNSLCEHKRESILKSINNINAGWEEGLKAQLEIVEIIKEMDLKGEIEVKRFTELDKEKVEMVLRNR